MTTSTTNASSRGFADARYLHEVPEGRRYDGFYVPEVIEEDVGLVGAEAGDGLEHFQKWKNVPGTPWSIYDPKTVVLDQVPLKRPKGCLTPFPHTMLHCFYANTVVKRVPRDFLLAT